MHLHNCSRCAGCTARWPSVPSGLPQDHEGCAGLITFKVTVIAAVVELAVRPGSLAAANEMATS